MSFNKEPRNHGRAGVRRKLARLASRPSGGYQPYKLMTLGAATSTTYKAGWLAELGVALPANLAHPMALPIFDDNPPGLRLVIGFHTDERTRSHSEGPSQFNFFGAEPYNRGGRGRQSSNRVPSKRVTS